MPIYDVHVYVEAEVFVTGVEADSFEEAADRAADIDLDAVIAKTAPTEDVAYVAFAGTILDYLVQERETAEGPTGESVALDQNLQVI